MVKEDPRCYGYLQQAVLEQHAPPLQHGIEQQEPDLPFFASCVNLPTTFFLAPAFFLADAQQGASQQATLQQAVLHLAASQQPDFGAAIAADETSVSASTRRARIDFFID